MISTVQQQDAYSDCTMIRAEINANNQKAQQLANEQGMKVAQNVAAGVLALSFGPSGSEWISRVPRDRTPQTYKRAKSI